MRLARWVHGYGIALLMAGIALLIPQALPVALHERTAFLLFSLSVMIASLRGGLGPGLVATVVGAIGGLYFYIEPESSFSVARPLDLVSVALFVVVGVSISAINEWLRRTRDSLAESERSLRHAGDELRRADRRKDEYLATLAHELRNPLGAIGNAAALLRASDGRHARAQQVLERQVLQMTRLLDDLLDVAQIARGRVAVRPERIDLAAEVKIACDAVTSLVDARRHRLQLDLPKAPLWVDADRRRIEEVLVNLIGNAVKFTPEGGEIRLSLAEHNSQAVIIVSDSGIGIPPEELPRLFQLFSQLDRSLAHTQGGLGIGLSLVKRLVEMHGGSIAAHSEGSGRGSQFTVRLPLAPAPPPRAIVAPSSTEHVQRRVLVVEDNDDAATMLADLLLSWGHEVRVAKEGLGALREAAAFHPEVVLLDLGLPGIDGFEVARRMRADETLPRSSLIAVTGYGQPDERRRSAAAGFDEHVTKPLAPEALERLLSQPPRRAQ